MKLLTLSNSQHKLYLGDSSCKQFQAIAPKAALAFCDPPYGVTKEKWDSSFYWKHDYLEDKADIVAVSPGMVNLQKFLKLTNMSYRWMISYWISNGMTRGAIGYANWIACPIFSKYSSLYRNDQDLIRIEDDKTMEKLAISSKDRQGFSHKGQKPLSMLIHLINLFTRPGDTILDTFLGSGTTLLACELTGRICVGCEIDPRSMEIAIKRFYCLQSQLKEGTIEIQTKASKLKKHSSFKLYSGKR